MPCSKESRHRSTDDSRVVISQHRSEGTYPNGRRVPALALVHQTIFESIDTYHKSIVDMACIYKPVDPDDPCKTKDCKKKDCADCVKQSRNSFNMVRSVTEKYTANGIVDGHKRYVSYDGRNTWEWHNRLVTCKDQYDVVSSYEQVPPLNPTQLELSNALRKITPSVDKFFPTVQLYEVLFELKELRKLLNLFNVKKSRNPVGEKWLGYHFGYLPLIRTIEDVLTILITLDNVIDTWNDFAVANRIMDFHGTLRKETYEGVYDYHQYDDVIRSTDIETKYTFTDDHKVHLYIRPQIIPGDMRFRVLLKSLGIDKPIAGLWELIPFSWLVDYFVNVDDMIGRWETGLNSMFKFDVANLGYSMHRKGVVSGRETITIKGGNGRAQSGWNESVHTHFERVPLPASALTDAIIPSEWGWEDGPSGTQWTYVLAVACNFCGRK